MNSNYRNLKHTIITHIITFSFFLKTDAWAVNIRALIKKQIPKGLYQKTVDVHNSLSPEEFFLNLSFYLENIK